MHAVGNPGYRFGILILRGGQDMLPSQTVRMKSSDVEKVARFLKSR